VSDPSSKTGEFPVVPIDAPSTIEGDPSAPCTKEGQSSAPATERVPSSSYPPAEEVAAGALTEKAIAIPAPATRDRATLTVITGLDAGRTFALDAMPTVIGRGPEALIAIDDGAISRAHARITQREDGRYQVEDLESTNGTFVRGRPVGKAVLASGDRLQLGPNVVLRFAVTDETEEALRHESSPLE
jgi:pSer/pThr/pTyr-binding forkhead associated (FHA) protein